MSAVPVQVVSVEEYLAAENDGEWRHEYVGGHLYALAGASLRHTLLAGSILAAVRPGALAAGCRAYQSDVKLRLGDVFYYPDVMVACGEVVDPYYETSPCLVVEVLSPSTERVDRGEKLMAYQATPGVLAVVLANPDVAHLEVHHRAADGWEARTYGPGHTLELACPAVALEVDALYAGLP